MKVVDVQKYIIQENGIELFNSETAYGNQTVAIVNNRYHYLGDQALSIMTAIVYYEKLNNMIFTTTEIGQIFIDNKITNINLLNQ